jgi:hypothetical protein
MHWILDGALGGLTFGIYHAYITEQQIKTHNAKMETLSKQYLKEYKSISNIYDN